MQNLQMTREAFFSRGMNDKIKPELLEKGFCSDALNCFVDEEKIKKRSGYTAVGNDQDINKPVLGLGATELVNGNKYVYHIRDDATSTNAHVRYWTGSGNWTALGSPTALTAGNKVEFEVAKNAVYMFNGVDTPHKVTSGVTDSTVAAIPVGKYAKWFHQFMFVAGVSSAPSRLYFSNINDPDVWTGSDYIDVNADDGDKITALQVLKDELLIFKKNRIWSLTGFGTGTFDLTDLNERMTGYGTLSHRSCINTGDDVYFLSFAGDVPHFRSIMRTKFGVLTYGGVISDPIQTTLSNVSKTALENCAGGFDGRRVWWSLTNSGGSNNNLVLVYDTVDKAWSRHTGINASCWLTFAVGTQQHLYFGEAGTDAQVYRFDGSTSDNGAAITFRWTSKKHTPFLERKSKWKYLYMDMDTNSTGYGVTVSLSPDGYTYNELATVNNSSAGSVWGTMIWGTGTWGAPEIIRERLPIANTTANGVFVRFSDSTLNSSIAIRNYELAFKPRGLRDD